MRRAVVALEALRGAGALAVDVVALTELQRFVLPQGLPLLTARLTSVVFGAVAIGALATPLCLHAFGTTGTLTLLGVVPPIVVIGVYPVLRRSDNASTEPVRGARTAHRRAPAPRALAGVVAAGTRAARGRHLRARHFSRDDDHPRARCRRRLLCGAGRRTRGVRRDRHVNDLHPGDWFGEIGLLEGSAADGDRENGGAERDLPNRRRGVP